jgi:prepilin-type N-terminal cleavage/methylation domain-containing protein
MNQLKRHPHPQSTQAGFTIIESLLALILVSILMVALSPVIVLSVATRVQARRVELASRAAKTYVDGVRSGLIDAPPIIISDDQFKDEFEKFAAPQSGTLVCDSAQTDYCTKPSGQPGGSVLVEKEVCQNGNCSTQDIEITTLYCIDQDGGGCTTDSTTDMIVQAVGYHPEPASNPPTTTQEIYDKFADKGYELGIRVYRASAFEEDMEKSEEAGAAAGVFKSELPLLTMTTAIVPNNPNFNELKDLYKSE